MKLVVGERDEEDMLNREEGEAIMQILSLWLGEVQCGGKVAERKV